MKNWAPRLMLSNKRQLKQGSDTAIGLLESDIAGLDAIIGDNVQWVPTHLSECLKDIEVSNEQLKNDPRFTRLSDLIKRLR